MAQNVRLCDIASALGLSETTVSRALSGKGRVSESTRKRVQEYIGRAGYRPNMLAKGLANSRSYNICAVLPPDAVTSHQSFFHGCLMGICACVEPKGYNVLITTAQEGEHSRIQRIMSGGAADGYILMRSTAGDSLVELLKEAEAPFVLIGSSDSPGVVCVDTENEENCRALTQSVLSAGFCRPGLLLGEMSFLVNRDRLRGFERGAEAFSERVCPQIRQGIASEDELKRALELLLRLDCDILFCGDDILSTQTLRLLRGMEKSVPVVSFYGSELLDLSGSIYASVDSDAHALGVKAAERLLDILSGTNDK